MSKANSSYNPAAGVCSPAVLLQLACPKYYEFLRVNCMLGRYKTKKGDEITILIPDEKRLAGMLKITDAQELVNEVESLIILQKINHVSAFASGFVTKSGVSVVVSKASEKEAVLENGCKITALSKYSTRYPYFVGYRITGTAKLSGAKAPEDKKKKAKRGGFAILSGSQSYLQKVQKKTEHLYKNPFSENEGQNIFFKKVYLQLRILKKHSPELFSSREILNHLGNEEVSTSYLLDMITDEVCAEALYNCLGNEGPCPDRLSKVGFVEFATEYNATLDLAVPSPREITVDEQSIAVSKIQNHLDARIYCKEAYKNDMSRLGKDLFIIFTNHQKYRWLKERRECLENEKSFENMSNSAFESFTYYTKWFIMGSDISARAMNPPNMEDDFRDFVGLMVCDGFLFIPAKFLFVAPYINTNGFRIVKTLPSILEKDVYSMNEVMARMSQTGGIFQGGARSKIHEKLDEYI